MCFLKVVHGTSSSADNVFVDFFGDLLIALSTSLTLSSS